MILSLVRFWRVLFLAALVISVPTLSAQATVRARRLESPANLHIITVCVDQVGQLGPYPGIRRDAELLSAPFEKIAGAAFKKVSSIEKITGRSATFANVEAGFKRIAANCNPEDTLIVIYCGLSTLAPSNGGDDQILLSDSKVESDSVQAALSPIHLASLCNQTRASHQLIILDCERAQKWVQAVQDGFVRLRRSQGTSLPSALILGLDTKSDNAISQVLDRRFSTALSGAADLTGNGDIYSHELLEYLIVEMPKWTVESGFLNTDLQLFAARLGRNFQLSTTTTAQRDTRRLAMHSSAAIQPAPEGKNFALLIASQDYGPGQKLNNPIADCRSIEAELRDAYGWDCKLIENPTKSQLIDLLTTYANQSYGEADQLLVYVAGHGTYSEKTRIGYIATVDSKMDDPDLSNPTQVSFGTIQDILDNGNCPHLLLAVDACYSGAFLNRYKSGAKSRDLYSGRALKAIQSEIRSRTTRKLVLPGAVEPVSDGVPGRYSPFAHWWLEALRSQGGSRGFLTLAELSSHIERVSPAGCIADFKSGSNSPGSNFLFVPVSQKKSVTDQTKEKPQWPASLDQTDAFYDPDPAYSVR